MFSCEPRERGSEALTTTPGLWRPLSHPCHMTMGPAKPTASSNTLMQVLLGGAYGWIVPIPSTTPEHGPSTVPHHTLLQPLPHTQSPHPPKPAAGVAWIPSPKLMYTEYVAIRRHRRWTSSAHTAAIGNRTRAPHTKHRENPHHPTLPHPTHQVTPTTHAHTYDTYACRKPWAEGRHTQPPHTHRHVVPVTSLTEPV